MLNKLDSCHDTCYEYTTLPRFLFCFALCIVDFVMRIIMRILFVFSFFNFCVSYLIRKALPL